MVHARAGSLSVPLLMDSLDESSDLPTNIKSAPGWDDVLSVKHRMKMREERKKSDVVRSVHSRVQRRVERY